MRKWERGGRKGFNSGVLHSLEVIWDYVLERKKNPHSCSSINCYCVAHYSIVNVQRKTLQFFTYQALNYLCVSILQAELKVASYVHNNSLVLNFKLK